MTQFNNSLTNELKKQIINSKDEKLFKTYVVERLESRHRCYKEKDITWLKWLNGVLFVLVAGSVVRNFFT